MNAKAKAWKSKGENSEVGQLSKRQYMEAIKTFRLKRDMENRTDLFMSLMDCIRPPNSNWLPAANFDLPKLRNSLAIWNGFALSK